MGWWPWVALVAIGFAAVFVVTYAVWVAVAAVRALVHR